MLNTESALTAITIKDLDTDKEYTTYINFKPDWDYFWADVEVNRTVWEFIILNHLTIEHFTTSYTRPRF